MAKNNGSEEVKDNVELTELYGGRVVVKFYEKSHQYWVSTDAGKTFKRKTGVTSFIGIKDKSVALGKWQQQITADFLLERIARGVSIDTELALEAVVQNEVQRETAADIGHEIHAYCEATIKKELKITKNVPEMPNFPEAITGVNSFMEWRENHKVKFLATETPVYSRKHDFIGTMDFEAMVDGELCVGDFKSSTGLYNSVRMQTAAYAEARMEEAGKRLYAGRWAVRLSKYTEEEYYKREERKKEIKKAIARIQGKEYKDYPIKQYKVFEAVFLDDSRSAMRHDFEAFLHCMALTKWDRATNGWGEDWSIDRADYSKLTE